MLLLTFLPHSARPGSHARSAPCQSAGGWAAPTFDRLQVEDYDWLTSGADGAAGRLSDSQQPTGLSGCGAGLSGRICHRADQTDQWLRIDAGIDEALQRGAHEVFVWAMPQICRDGYVRIPTSDRFRYAGVR